MKYKSNKIVTAVLAILLVIVIAGAAALVGVLSNGFKDWTKFQPEEQTETPADEEQGGEEELPVLDDEGEEMESGVVHAMPKAMTFRTAASLAATPAAQAETYDSVTLTATVKPDSAADKTVDWAVAFVNPSSEWATGKTVTDYVTVTPSSDGSTTATVKCLQPFGEQIKITVTSRMNTEATASCTVDFAARPTAFSLTGFDFTKIPVVNLNIFVVQSSEDIFDINPLSNDPLVGIVIANKQTVPNVVVSAKTACTTGEVTVSSFEIDGKATAGLAAALRSQGFTIKNEYQSLFIDPPSGDITTSLLFSFVEASGIEDTIGSSSSVQVSVINKLNTAIQANADEYDFDVRLTVETNVGTYEIVQKYKVDRSSVVFGVESIQLSDSNVVI